jgi:hypothetical protein
MPRGVDSSGTTRTETVTNNERARTMQRVTNQDIENAVAGYRRALASVGVVIDADDTIGVAAPYGQVMYLIRWEGGKDNRRPVHDLPGFTGSSGSGFLTKREAYDRIWLAARTLGDLAYRQGYTNSVGGDA